jgi:Cu-Zn family superoxide dismutase
MTINEVVMMLQRPLMWISAISVIGLTGCAQLDQLSEQKAVPKAIARMQPVRFADGSQLNISGTIRFQQEFNHVVVDIDLKGLIPQRILGLHIHEDGNCYAPHKGGSGQIFNPDQQRYGFKPPELNYASGSLPNLTSDNEGRIKTRFLLNRISIGTNTLNESEWGIIHRALLLKQFADNYTTQPDGKAGLAVACGVIIKNH